jgi:transcriptional regulator with XRE-family HTH domain
MNEFEIYLTSIGKAIKKQRIFKNITQEDLINKVHKFEFNSSSKRQLAQETLSRIENGHFNPSIKQIFLVCKALETTPADLLFLSQNLEK